MHQEFYISVTPVKQDDYLIRIEQVSPGVPLAEELVTWPVDEWLAEAGQLLNDPLLRILRGNVVTLAGVERDRPAADLLPTLVAFGQRLYDALFQGRIRDSWVTAQGIAQNRRESLRLRLGLKGDRLQRLPWEVLHAGNRPIATGTDVIFSRYQSSFTPLADELRLRQPQQNDQILRILMVLAAPTDQEVLQLEQEAENLKQELQADRQSSLEQQPEVQLTILRQPGREQLTQALEHGDYNVLHYAGHSNLGHAGGDVYLVNDKGLTESLGGDDLAGLLVNNGVSLAVFNSCRGVYAATNSPNGQAAVGNLTDALLKRGIPAVLAMAERIPDEVALSLSRLFYRNLKQQKAVDLSLNRARQGLISSYSSDQLYWALPILYLHPAFDGYLQQQDRSPDLPLDNGHDDDADFDLDLLTGWDAAPNATDSATVKGLYAELMGTARGAASPQTAEMAGSDVSAASSGAAAREVAPYLTQGQQCYAIGDDLGAIAAYADALKVPGLSTQQLAAIYNQLGLALQAHDKLPEAITAFTHAVKRDPTLESAQQNLQQATSASAKAAATPLSSSPSSGPVAIGAIASPWWQRPQMLIPATIALVLLVAGGMLVAQSVRQRDGSSSTVINTPTPAPSSAANAPKTAALTAKAMTSFASKDVPAGKAAVEQLLDQQDFVAVKQVLADIPPQQVDDPDISFLRGRLAWQSARGKNRDFDVEDARRAWEGTVKVRPEPLVYNLLGLALYTEGNRDRAKPDPSKLAQAKAVWLKTLELSAKSPQGDLEVATAYAGLALVAQKTAGQQPGQRDRLKREAIDLRDRALSIAAAELQVSQLWLGWRWSEVAIKDWQKLLAAK